MTRLLDFARRRTRARDGAHLLERLRGAPELPTVADETGLPLASLRGVRSFYDDLHAPAGEHGCSGTACWAARGAPEMPPPPGSVRCFGRCYEAPARATQVAGPIPIRALTDAPVVLRHALADGPDVWADYLLPDGDAILDAIEASGLRGRGGAAYPTGAKWLAARRATAPDRIVVANGDEGDPGSYVDRWILEEDPHALLAGMLACARAIGSHTGIVFVRGEYSRAADCVREAIEEAHSRGVLGANFDVRVVRGAGSYVAGEETALLRAIEGLRAEPQPKPPYPAERGLFGLPTVVQNIETLAVVPWVAHTRRRSNTKAICLSGAVRVPGLVEVDLGTPLRRVLVEGGGGPPDETQWAFALVGGPMGRVVSADELDVPLDYDALPGMGHGGVVVFDDRVSPAALARHLFEFAASESCGTCAPCRVGTSQLAACDSLASLERLLDTLEMGSLCGFGTGVPRPLRDLIRCFGERVLR